MTPRGLLTTIGATALGLGIVIGGTTAIQDAFAQETTPAAETSAQAEQESDFEAQRTQAYDSFVAALATELGTDETAVDAAIRTALKQQVNEREAAGDLDTEQAAALEAVIDVTEAPLFLGMGGPGGFGGRGEMHGPDGRGGFKGHGGEQRDLRGGSDDRGPRDEFDDATRELPEDSTLPAELPGDDGASDQSASAPVVPAESMVII